jgi:hypothetical protein
MKDFSLDFEKDPLIVHSVNSPIAIRSSPKKVKVSPYRSQSYFSLIKADDSMSLNDSQMNIQKEFTRYMDKEMSDMEQEIKEMRESLTHQFEELSTIFAQRKEQQQLRITVEQAPIEIPAAESESARTSASVEGSPRNQTEEISPGSSYEGRKSIINEHRRSFLSGTGSVRRSRKDRLSVVWDEETDASEDEYFSCDEDDDAEEFGQDAEQDVFDGDSKPKQEATVSSQHPHRNKLKT